MSAGEEASPGRDVGASGHGLNTTDQSNTGGGSGTSSGVSSSQDGGVRQRNVNQIPSSSVPASNNNSNQQGHHHQVIPNAPAVPARVTDAVYQQQVRVVLVLIIALAIGFLYLQLEHQTLSPKRFKLIPTTTYEALQNSQKQPSPPVTKSKTPVSPEPDGDFSEEVVSETESMIPEKFQLQAKYLSRVLQTIGDLSRKIEVGENITKPIGGIIEMRTELVKPEEEEEEEVPEYMKELGSIINGMKKSKTPQGKRVPKFKPSIKKAPPPPLPTERQPTEAEEKIRRAKEWDSFMDDLVEALYEEEQEEKRRKGIVDEPPAPEKMPKDKFTVFDDIDDDENDDDLELDEEDEEDPFPPEHYEKLANDPNHREVQKIFQDIMDEREKEEEEDFKKRATEKRPTIFDDDKEIQEGLALLKVMVEARKFAKAANALKESEAKGQEESKQDHGNTNTKKPRFENDNSYTL